MHRTESPLAPTAAAACSSGICVLDMPHHSHHLLSQSPHPFLSCPPADSQICLPIDTLTAGHSGVIFVRMLHPHQYTKDSSSSCGRRSIASLLTMPFTPIPSSFRPPQPTNYNPGYQKSILFSERRRWRLCDASGRGTHK